SETTSVSRTIGRSTSAKVSLAGRAQVGHERVELLVRIPQVGSHVLTPLHRPNPLLPGQLLHRHRRRAGQQPKHFAVVHRRLPLTITGGHCPSQVCCRPSHCVVCRSGSPVSAPRTHPSVIATPAAHPSSTTRPSTISPSAASVAAISSCRISSAVAACASRCR